MIYPMTNGTVLVTAHISAETHDNVAELAQVQGKTFEEMLATIITKAVNPQELDGEE